VADASTPAHVAAWLYANTVSPQCPVQERFAWRSPDYHPALCHSYEASSLPPNPLGSAEGRAPVRPRTHARNARGSAGAQGCGGASPRSPPGCRSARHSRSVEKMKKSLAAGTRGCCGA